jgi:hypothetical protein
MLSKRLGAIDLDQQCVNADLEKACAFNFDRAYQDYALGGWEACSLWNKSGDHNDGLSYEFPEPAKITEYGRSLPYIREIAERHFAMEHCKAARIFIIRKGQLTPHRDYLEFKKGFTRIHLVLTSNPLAFNSEQADVYQMCIGEIWYVDGGPVHSAANFSEQPRVHLVFDFDPDIAYEDLLRDIIANEKLPQVKLKLRPPISSEQIEAISKLSSIVDSDGYLLTYMIPFLARIHFFYDVSSRDTYLWLKTISKNSDSQLALEKASEIMNKYIGE